MKHFNFLIVRLNNNFPLRIWTKITFVCKIFSFCNISIFQFKQITLENFQLALFDAMSVVTVIIMWGSVICLQAAVLAELTFEFRGQDCASW